MCCAGDNRAILMAVLVFSCAVLGCNARTDEPQALESGAPLEAAGSAEMGSDGNDEANAGERRARVLFLGTSLTAGLGLTEEEAYPARVAGLLEDRGLAIEAINAGVSGDTSAGGLGRVDWLLQVVPDVVLVELGANDGLRGLPVAMTDANLREVVARSQAVGAQVIVAGMMMPPNYGEDYTRAFAETFPRVARDTGSVLVPFLLEGVAADPDLNLADGIHPNAEGHERMARTVLPFVLSALEASRGDG